MNIDNHTVMEIIDILERLRTFREGTYYHTEASAQAEKMVEKLMKEVREDCGMKDDKKHLAFVYHHDDEENPDNLEEVMSQFEYMVAEPHYVLYNTKDGILDAIRKDGTYTQYSNTFIIMEGKLYPVKPSITVDW